MNILKMRTLTQVRALLTVAAAPNTATIAINTTVGNPGTTQMTAVMEHVQTMIPGLGMVIGLDVGDLGPVGSIMTDGGAIVMFMTVSAVTRAVKRDTSPGIVRIFTKKHPGNTKFSYNFVLL